MDDDDGQTFMIEYSILKLMSTQSMGSPILLGKIMLNSLKVVILTLFMLTLAVAAFNLGYGGAGAFFAIITLVFMVILYKRIQNERVRAKFGEYRVKWLNF